MDIIGADAGPDTGQRILVPNVYEFRVTDFCERQDAHARQSYVGFKANEYVINCADAPNDVPEEVRKLQGPASALDTEGHHNACAIHAVFGRPTSSGNLRAANARHLALQLLTAVPEDAEQSEHVATSLQTLRRTLWEEFVLRKLRGDATTESTLFWEALVRIAPTAADEARSKFVRYNNKLTHVKKNERAGSGSKQVFFYSSLGAVRTFAGD